MENIGFIGLGVMGSPMCEHILESGYPVTVYSRTKGKAEALIKKGAKWVDSPASVAECSDIVFTIIGFPKDVEDVYLGENGLISKAKSGSIFCDMTTTDPELEERISASLLEKGVAFVDAPVSGGDVGAKKGTLTIMCGGDEKAYQRLTKFFKLMGSSWAYFGRSGAGQRVKLCNQIVIAGTMTGVSEALAYAKESGLDRAKVIETIGKGAAGCWTLDNLAPRVINDNFEPGFMIEHFIKDMDLAIKDSASSGLELSGLSETDKHYKKLAERGLGKKGTQALYKFYEKE